MQSRGLLLALLFSVVIFSISGLLPSVSAEQLNLNQDNCENYLGGTWSIDECTIEDGAEIGFDINDEPDILIISGPVTLDITEDGDLLVSGGIQIVGTVNVSGFLTLEEEAGILNSGTLTIHETGVMINEGGDYLGAGVLENFGLPPDEFTQAGIVNDDGDFEALGVVTNSGKILLNEGEMSFSNSLVNTDLGIVENNANLFISDVTNDGLFLNNPNGQFNIISGQNTIGVFSNENSGTITNNGLIDIDPSGQIENNGAYVSGISSEIILGGLVNNYVIFTNEGFVNIKLDGLLVNHDTFVNNGIMNLTSSGAQIATFDGTPGVVLTNNNLIYNHCGVILGNYDPIENPPIDECDFDLQILSPSNGALIPDYETTTFIASAEDRDPFGVPTGSTDDVQWTSSKEANFGTGSPLLFQLTALGNHKITAITSDPDGNTIETSIDVLVSQVDNDNDGYVVQNDCNDNPNVIPGTNPPLTGFDINPGKSEIFGNGVDDNCDGNQDEGFTDADDDGFDSGLDCNDDNATVYPNAPELIDGLDNDCDGTVPSNEIDGDGDFYIPGIFDSNIWAGDTSVIGGEDCNDSESATFPGNLEIIDGIANNCIDGIPDNEVDNDSDGYIEAVFDSNIWVGDTSVVGGEDCNDAQPLSFPGNPEIDDDGIDNDCDGIVDSVSDFDEDGFTNAQGDCNDGDATVYPNAPELVDGLDNDCNNVLLSEEIDDDFDGYIDGMFDENGWDGTLEVLGENDCNDIPIEGLTIYPGAPELDDGLDNDCDGVVPPNEIDEDNDGSTSDLDCDDKDPARSPDFVEIVDGLDNDCDGVIPTNEIDDDVDGFIDGMFDSSGWMGIPSDMLDNDCNDLNATIYPGAIEILDGLDNDCDGLLLGDEIDDDGDGQAEYEGDCDDSNKFNFLGNDERDDGFDNDCDAEIDEGFDMDGDGFTPLAGGDCDDTNPLVNQQALEIPDGIDNDCNGFVDDLLHKFSTPELQENLDDKTIRYYEKQVEDLEEEIEDLEYENRKLDKKADKYEDKAEDALEGDTRKAAYYQAKADRYEDKGYEKKAAYFQAKADKALEGDEEKAAKYQAKADELRAEIASNESLIEMYGKEILVIDMSIGNIPVDWSQTIVITYDNLTDDAFDDIFDEIKDNLKEIEKLEEKAAKEQEKIDKELEKGNEEKAAEHEQHKLQALEEIEILEDLNTVLKCAIDFTDEMLLKEVEFSIKIDRDSDDAEEGNDSDNLLDMKLKSSDLDLVEESEYVGLRFNDIPLEKGQIIKSAYIQFTSEDKDDGNAVVTIYGHDIDDAPTFTNSDGDISSRTLTSASVTWNIPDWDDNKSKSAQQTSDITSIVEEIVNRPNWSEDNSMVFIISDGQGSDRDAYTYDEKSSKAAKLYITTLTDDDDKHGHHGHDDDDDDDD